MGIVTLPSATHNPRCSGCGQDKAAWHYLCRSCWSKLSETARIALRKRDDMARMRLLELYRQLFHDVPLSEIRITP